MVSKGFAALVALVVFASMGYGAQASRAQDKLSLLDKIKESITAAEPQFSLEKTLQGGAAVIGCWASKDGNAQVTIEEFPTPEEASVHMLKAFKGIAVGNGKKLQNVGDEANIWENYGADGRTTIHFRKGNLVVFVNTPVGIARRFAHLVDEQIK